MPSESEMPRHHAYVLRFWETRSLPPDPTSQWRFSLENLRGPGEHKFPDLDSLASFLEAEIGEVVERQCGEDVAEPGREADVDVAGKGEGAATFDPADLSILLVEDDDAIRRSMDRWLRKVLPEAIIVGAGANDSASMLVRSQSPDVVLIDVAPPKLDGADVVRRLRAVAPQAKIVALTMGEPRERCDAVMEAGANVCLKIWEIRRRLLPVLNELLTEVEGKALDGKTVVCIEDEIDMLSLIRFTLEHHNINLITALGGQQGLDVVQRTKPDLVLLDLMMPEVDGWEVYQRMRQDEETKNIPVIVLTVLDPHWVESRGMDLVGITDYVTKPFVPRDLVERVGRALEAVA